MSEDMIPDRAPMPHGDGSFRRLLDRLKDTWGAFLVIGAIVTVSFTFALSVTGFVGLPDVARDHEVRISKLESAESSAKRERAEIRQLLLQTRCMLLADRQNAPIERCLETIPVP